MCELSTCPSFYKCLSTNYENIITQTIIFLKPRQYMSEKQNFNQKKNVVQILYWNDDVYKSLYFIL